MNFKSNRCMEVQDAHTHKYYASLRKASLFFLTIIVFFSTAVAQSLPSAVFKAKEVTLASAEGDTLSNYFNEYRVVKLNFIDLNSYVKDYAECALTLVVENTIGFPIQTFNLVLEENDLRAPDYLAVINDGTNRTLDMKAMFGAVNTYKGIAETNPANIVRLNISTERIWGYILTGADLTYIEPLTNYITEAPANYFVMHTSTDNFIMNRKSNNNGGPLSIEDEELGCGMSGQNGEENIPGEVIKASEDPSRECIAYTLEIATEADFQMSDFFGVRIGPNNENSFTGVNIYLLELLNVSQGAYSSLGVRFAVTYQNAWWHHSWTTSSNGDPYTDNTDMIWDIKDDFEDEWNANFSGVNRDVAHMWTGQSHPMGAVGYAGGPDICESSDAYSISRFLPLELYNKAQKNIVAHELAHNLSAGHDPDSRCPDPHQVGAGPIMCRTVRKTTFFFSLQSRNELKNFLTNNGSCLDPVSLPCPGTDIGTNGGGVSSSSNLAKDEHWVDKKSSNNTPSMVKGNESSKHATSISIYNLTGQLLYKRTGSGVDYSVSEWGDYQKSLPPAIIVQTIYEDGSTQFKKIIF